MRYLVAVVSLLCLSPSIFAEVVISHMSYDNVADQLIITAQFPGKCLPHELSLTKVRQKSEEYRFRLDVNNHANDPCNAINEKTESFSLSEITMRPAKILVSPNRDGSRPHLIEVPPHQKADVVKISYHQTNATLQVSLMVRGTITPSRFYIDLEGTCTNSHCEGVVRDKFALQFADQKQKEKLIEISPTQISRPQTLTFSIKGGSKSVRIHLP